MNLKEYRLLVTPTSYGRDDSRLKSELEALVGRVVYNPTGKPLTSSEVAQLLPGMDGYIAGLDEIDAHALNKADRLKVIARYGVGVDNVDLNAAREKGIVVTNTPGANSVSVAELALGLILALARQIPAAVEAVHLGKWPRYPGISLEGKSIGILGLGAIGKQLARRLKGFDCRILAFDPYADADFAKANQVELTTMEALIEQSDFISLHIPLLPETRGIVSDSFLNKMKKGSFLINTSRGEVVDEHALFKAIQSDHLKGAGLDAFSVEPPDPKNPLLALPQVIATPHLGAQTDGATSNMGWLAMRDCLAVLKNEKPNFRIV
ncbi:MAG TPA: phosphoglycerate dehydrogenase [Anaerolineales bacterium]|jgi:D-3-phosphoglycerate dehydrogenase|nr:phosphoglycerate dehydrogenase [Anaerolineales bacterium]